MYNVEYGQVHPTRAYRSYRITRISQSTRRPTPSLTKDPTPLDFGTIRIAFDDRPALGLDADYGMMAAYLLELFLKGSSSSKAGPFHTYELEASF